MNRCQLANLVPLAMFQGKKERNGFYYQKALRRIGHYHQGVFNSELFRGLEQEIK